METKIDAETTQYCIQNATWTTVNDAPPKLETFSHVVEASFSLPLSSDLLYLVARGALSHGMVQILSSGVAESNYMAVHVSVAYDYAHMLDRIKVCLLQPEEGQRGVGIFSPADLPYPARKYRTHFDVVVQVPAMVKGHPALVKRFESDMPLFSYQVDLPRDAVLFDHLSLSTSNKPIIVNSLATNTAMLHTMNSKIEGAFSTASYLSLHTLSAPIKADVQMLNANDGTQTQLWMQTSHSGINATAELVSTSTHATEGSFKIHGRTSGGLLDISALNAPIDHVLDLTAETSNALASVSLHRTWQGAFHLLASRFFTPAIDADTSSSDPSGGSRHRRVHTKGSKENVVEGYAEWVPKKGQTGGELKVITSNAPLHVTL
ncbi:hypothetical protein OBBRIDRAFT_832382 [Obba rivulosa]|uniref:Uncharacterized protein n=1 Tax=Obba rivulosa TaxID=1052685 RepID=A0A8E2DQ94_9APHY|nr:hypothetical protein OBBRIDRAFT_832382 [Obba rivulosa]